MTKEPRFFVIYWPRTVMGYVDEYRVAGTFESLLDALDCAAVMNKERTEDGFAAARLVLVVVGPDAWAA